MRVASPLPRSGPSLEEKCSASRRPGVSGSRTSLAAGTGRPRARCGRERCLDALSDTDLLANYLAAKGREEARIWVQELFRRHYPKVVGWCLRFARDREEAYDLAQAIFTKACRHLESFRGESKVSRRPPSVRDDELDELPDTAASHPDQALQREAWARLVRTLLDEALDETEKKVFTLHYGDEVPLEAITRLLGLSNRSGAKAYIVSARRKLRRAARLWKARKDVLDA